VSLKCNGTDKVKKEVVVIRSIIAEERAEIPVAILVHKRMVRNVV
jgi:hypothetical protein